MVSETDTDRFQCNADRISSGVAESDVGRNCLHVRVPSFYG